MSAVKQTLNEVNNPSCIHPAAFKKPVVFLNGDEELDNWVADNYGENWDWSYYKDDTCDYEEVEGAVVKDIYGEEESGYAKFYVFEKKNSWYYNEKLEEGYEEEEEEEKEKELTVEEFFEENVVNNLKHYLKLKFLENAKESNEKIKNMPVKDRLTDEKKEDLFNSLLNVSWTFDKSNLITYMEKLIRTYTFQDIKEEMKN